MAASLGSGMIVEKKVFELQHFTTSGGATLNPSGSAGKATAS